MARKSVLSSVVAAGLVLVCAGVAWRQEFKSDLPPCLWSWNNCQATYTWPDGRQFVGEWKDGKPNGQGTQTWPNGDKYVGEWKDGSVSGQGTYTWPDGRQYVGEFKDGWQNGLGTLYASDGSVKQAGLWENDKFVKKAPVPSPAKQSVASAPAVQQQAPAASNTATNAVSTRRVALLIGNSRYSNAPRLENPKNDIALLEAALKKAGFSSVTVKADLSGDEMKRALLEFASVADTADFAVVYYAGHAIQVGGVNYLIPVDAKLRVDRDIDLETIDAGKALSALSGARKLKVLVLDSCRTNPFEDGMRRTTASRSVGRGLGRMEADAGELIVFAAKAGQVALDGQGKNSPFAEAFASRLNQEAPLEIRRFFDFVRDDVLAKTNKQQQPFTYGSLPSNEEFSFNK